MGISQSTYQRILTEANKKITLALTQGRAISIVGEEQKVKIDCWECQNSSEKPGMICRPCNEESKNNV